MVEYKFFGKIRIYDNPDRVYELGGVSKDEKGVFGNGLYAILYFIKTLSGKIIPHHCEIVKVWTERNMVNEQMIDCGTDWYGAKTYCRFLRKYELNPTAYI